jgi:hypothetical protein
VRRINDRLHQHRWDKFNILCRDALLHQQHPSTPVEMQRSSSIVLLD